MLSRTAVTRCVKSLVRTFTSDCPKPYTVPKSPWGENRAARLELAAAYRTLDALNLNEGVCNHLSVMAPRADGQGEGMLVFPYGLHWREVTASNLVCVEYKSDQVNILEGGELPEVAASCIHLGIRQVRPDAKVILHTHMPYATAIACMKDPELLMISQNALRFYNRVAYDDDYTGIAIAIEEGKRLGKALGDKSVLFMGHHGIVCVAPTISLAFDMVYYLERSAELQVLTGAMNKEVGIIPEKDCARMSEIFWRHMQSYADAHFYGQYRLLRKTQPDFEL
ncbi:putative aldolase class 2 protein RP493 [Palaemon carinicauda]|uniref:putative aldolase class 2 protein RP493 n=1 Tax=Palaemon carinicauda TaxID=392227 RepID=UPI0035B63A7E